MTTVRIANLAVATTSKFLVKPLTMAALTAFCVMSGPVSAQSSFTYLGDVSVLGISGDGSVAVGFLIDSSTNGPSAYRWTQAFGMQRLGALSGDNWSNAGAISSDGSVVVGTSYGGSGSRNPFYAYRWTQAGGMQDLGMLNNGNMSLAYGVSADGSVVVGTANDGAVANAPRAFRWTLVGGMQSLGVIAGFSEAIAKGASRDGSVVVGWVTDRQAGDSSERAFRWTQSAGMQNLGTLDGGSHSFGLGVSADGSVVVGWSDDLSAGNALRAFRWTEAGGMKRLGVLNDGFFSSAEAVSANGQVVVGWSHDGAANNAMRAFRWTPATGMQSVEQWLRANGVTVPVDITSSATATNIDGSVVAGQIEAGGAYIARVSGQGNGLVTLGDVSRSLQSTAKGTGDALRSAGMLLNGAHSRPLERRVPKWMRAFWVAGDWGQDDHGERNGSIGLAEVGGGYNFDTLQFNIAAGQTWARQDLSLNGHARTNGTYVLAEVLAPLGAGADGSGLWVTVGTHCHWGDSSLRRGYLNAGVADASKGTPDVETWGLRARFDWEKATHFGHASFSPYADLSYSQARMESYTETGGAFPARFDSRKENATEFRLGLNAEYPLSAIKARLIGTAEAVHHFESKGATTSGQMIGLFSFDLGGEPYRKNWLRLGAGIEGELAGGTASLSVNATGRGEAPNYWVAVSYRLAF